MKTNLTLSLDRLSDFDIFKDTDCGTCKSLNWDFEKYKSQLSKIIRISIQHDLFEKLDLNEAYKYMLLRHNRKVDKWYNNSLFSIFSCPLNRTSGSSCFYFVRNNKNGHCDNIVFKEILDSVDKRLKDDLIACGCTKHSIDRANMRIPDCVDLNRFKTEEYILNEVNRNSVAAKPKKASYAVLSLLNHNMETVDYRMDRQGNVYVISNRIVLTVHCNESERWARK